MDTQQNCQWLHAEGTTPIKGWVNGVPLEALEKVTEKIDTLTVFGGLDGVLKQLVTIR